MECVNEFIHLEIKKNPDIQASISITTQDESYVYMSYEINEKDCLFDLSRLNYEFQIRVSKTYLEKYNEPFEIIVEKQAICCDIQSKLIDVLNCNLTGIQRKLYLESIILYFLYQTQKSNALFQLNCNTCSFLNNPIEVEKIQKAKHFILDNLDGKLNIQIIAAHVGTNQCYLKKGFKEVFNQTIFECIQESRMVKAKYHLQNTNDNISEIAQLVGYSSLSSFSQAYKNYFGISPTEQSKEIISNL
ncbi:MAG: hypothetical protein RIR96_980 [Bacteroidota bacterium]